MNHYLTISTGTPRNIIIMFEREGELLLNIFTKCF